MDDVPSQAVHLQCWQGPPTCPHLAPAHWKVRPLHQRWLVPPLARNESFTCRDAAVMLPMQCAVLFLRY